MPEEVPPILGHAQMGRIVSIVGLAFLLCTLAAGSVDPDRWSGGAQAFVLIIAGATVMMNIEALLRAVAARRSGPARQRESAYWPAV